MSTQPIPEGFHTVTPYLLVHNVAQLMDFLTRAFAAKEIHRTSLPEQTTIAHAQMQIGNSMVMMGQASDDYKPTLSMLYLYVEDMDEVYHRALAAGGTSLQEPTNKSYGDRCGAVQDPCGNQWWIATHIRDLP